MMIYSMKVYFSKIFNGHTLYIMHICMYLVFTQIRIFHISLQNPHPPFCFIRLFHAISLRYADRACKSSAVDKVAVWVGK